MTSADKPRKPKPPKFTVHQFNAMFPTEEACLDFIRDSLYPDGITCRKCGGVTKHHRLERRKAYSCQECGTHVYPLAGTIFAKSSTPLKSWMYAMYLMSSTRCGISAKQLERELGVTYKTAWRMFNQLRKLLAEGDEVLFGTVEFDETRIGGIERWKHASKRSPLKGRGTGEKTIVAGAVQRRTETTPGKVIAQVVPDTAARTLLPAIKSRVLPASTVYTDDWRAYDSLGKRGYEHRRINHTQGVYVDGDVHTNTIEGFWSLVKSGLRGVYHSVGTAHLQSYLDEYAFRYNHRDDPSPMFMTIADQVPETRYGNYGTYHPMP
jgi:transposase